MSDRLCFRMSTAMLMIIGFGACTPASAEYLWLQRHAEGELRVHYGELVNTGHGHAGHGHDDGGAFRLLRNPEVSVSGKKSPLNLRIEGDDAILIGAPVHGDARVSQLVLGEDKTIAVRYVAQWGRENTQGTGVGFEFVPDRPGGDSFVLRANGSPSVGAAVQLSSDSGWSRTYRTDAEGRFTVETPWTGVYVLSVGRRLQTPGSLEGRPYTAVQHATSLTFSVTGPNTSQRRPK